MWLYNRNMLFFFSIKSINKRFGQRMRNRIEIITLGFNTIAPIISKCKNFNVALVIPHPGHGKLYINLEGQTIMPACPSKFA